jgi:hypothetical protein
MTRRLRPPVPLSVLCDESGAPRTVRHAGRTLPVTHVAASWLERPRWWRAGGVAPVVETRRYRVVLDGRLLFEIHHDGGAWQLDRILD